MHIQEQQSSPFKKVKYQYSSRNHYHLYNNFNSFTNLLVSGQIHYQLKASGRQAFYCPRWEDEDKTEQGGQRSYLRPRDSLTELPSVSPACQRFGYRTRWDQERECGLYNAQNRSLKLDTVKNPADTEIVSKADHKGHPRIMWANLRLEETERIQYRQF